jgi:hypothetical protein
LANKKVILFVKRFLPVDRAGNVGPRGIPPVGRAGGLPGYISPHLPQKYHFIQQKSEKKRKGGEEERRESGEALFTRRFGGIFSF